MLKARVIPCLDVKDGRVVKGVNFVDLIDAGDHYIGPVKAGQTIRIVDVDGNEAADTLFFNANDPSERYSAVDTVREQGKVYLTTGTELRSNLNNVMLTISNNLYIYAMLEGLIRRISTQSFHRELRLTLTQPHQTQQLLLKRFDPAVIEIKQANICAQFRTELWGYRSER